MSARQARKARRAAEREARKLAEKQHSSEAKLAANRANAQKSSGPKSDEGKARSSRNSFKHGLYSKQLVLPGENPAELDRLKADLFAEHQPTNTTEELLVNELAEQYWRIRRFRLFEAKAWENPDPEQSLKLLSQIQRLMSAAERGFHKALNGLRQLQKQRGFVPTIPQHTEPQPSRDCQGAALVGFVPPTSPAVGFVPQNSTSPVKAILSQSLGIL